MEKLNLIFAIIFLQGLQSSAQVITFEKTYGGTSYDWGNSVQQTSDGGYIIAGATYSFGAGDSDVYLVKTDAIGDTLWTKTYGGTSDNVGNSVQQTDDGGYIIGGIRGRGAYLVKTDVNGNTLWTKTFGGTNVSWGNSVQQTDDGGYIIGGYTRSFGAGKSDVYLVKTDAKGDTLWTKTYGGTDLEEGSSVQQTSDGGYIIGGWTGILGVVAGDEEGDVYLVKTDANGDTLWTKTYGGRIPYSGTSVQQTDDGGYIIAGGTYSFGTRGPDAYLVKTDANGNTLWRETFGEIPSDWGTSVQQTSDGGYIIAGGTWSFGAGESDVYLIKTDSFGNVGEEVSIEEELTSNFPSRFWIAQNYPNPFNPITTIEFSLPTSGLVTLAVYDVLGSKVEAILNQHMDAGTHKLQWDASNVPAGIYFVKMVIGDFSETRKAVLLK